MRRIYDACPATHKHHASFKMSSEAHPISPSRFAEAIQDLPVENLYAKAYEIHNSVAHLQRSNAQLQEYSDSIKNDASLDEDVRAGGDKDCLEAIRENDIVIQRQLERVDLLKQEVERRGGRWHEADSDKQRGVNGTTQHDAMDSNEPSSRPGGSLTDDELRRRLEEQMGDDDEEGMHL